MYEAFEYVAKNGILLDKDYTTYSALANFCIEDKVQK